MQAKVVAGIDRRAKAAERGARGLRYTAVESGENLVEIALSKRAQSVRPLP
jgi:hypothetical protein